MKDIFLNFPYFNTKYLFNVLLMYLAYNCLRLIALIATIIFLVFAVFGRNYDLLSLYHFTGVTVYASNSIDETFH